MLEFSKKTNCISWQNPLVANLILLNSLDQFKPLVYNPTNQKAADFAMQAISNIINNSDDYQRESPIGSVWAKPTTFTECCFQRVYGNLDYSICKVNNLLKVMTENGFTEEDEMYKFVSAISGQLAFVEQSADQFKPLICNPINKKAADFAMQAVDRMIKKTITDFKHI